MSRARAITAVAAAIAALPGVEDVKVHLATGEVDVHGPEQPTLADLRAAVSRASYELMGVVR
ncbi:heavy-metal-associated domain-containing protein [Cellulomonas carbonis]